MSEFEIKCDEYGKITNVFMDGEELENLKSVTVDISSDYMSEICLTFHHVNIVKR